MMKGLSIVLLTVVLAFVFTNTAYTAGDGSWERVKKKGKLAIGIDDAFPPMEFRNEKNELIGFDIDVSKELARRLGIKVVYIPTAWDTIILSLKLKQFDIIFSTMSITAGREKEIALTSAYIMERQVIVVNKDNKKIRGLKDLSEETIMGVHLGPTTKEALKKLNRKFKEIRKYEMNNDGFLDLKTCSIDALAVDELIGRYYLSQKPGEYIILEEDLLSEPIGVGLRKEDVALKDKIQLTLDGMFKDGTMKKISIKWFSNDITSRK
jgi:polar amino acid transport system substrate-binding protein